MLIMILKITWDFKCLVKGSQTFCTFGFSCTKPCCFKNLSPCTAAPCDCSGFLIKQQQYPAIFALCAPFCKPAFLPPPSSTTWFSVFLPSSSQTGQGFRAQPEHVQWSNSSLTSRCDPSDQPLRREAAQDLWSRLQMICRQWNVGNGTFKNKTKAFNRLCSS